VPIETVAGAVVAFVRLLTGNAELIRHIDQLEERYDRQFKAVFAAIRQLRHFVLGHSDESDSSLPNGTTMPETRNGRPSRPGRPNGASGIRRRLAARSGGRELRTR
jgi:hypothetical protein